MYKENELHILQMKQKENTKNSNKTLLTRSLEQFIDAELVPRWSMIRKHTFGKENSSKRFFDIRNTLQFYLRRR